MLPVRRMQPHRQQRIQKQISLRKSASDVSHAATTVDKTVVHQLTITERIFDKVQHFAETKGIDIVMAIIVLVIGYVISREIKVWTRNILKRSNVDPNAIGFITEIVYLPSVCDDHCIWHGGNFHVFADCGSGRHWSGHWPRVKG